ncbi:MAG: hypothetical protein LQ337_008475 [Flavoplaca oasis]|nr:MAG: hypothetical protein LQ337_008475 [Flavoplaca oasis]
MGDNLRGMYHVKRSLERVDPLRQASSRNKYDQKDLSYGGSDPRRIPRFCTSTTPPPTERNLPHDDFLCFDIVIVLVELAYDINALD